MKPPSVPVLLRLLLLAAVGVGGASGCSVLPATTSPPAPAPARPASATPSALIVDVRGPDSFLVDGTPVRNPAAAVARSNAPTVVVRADPRMPWQTAIRALDELSSQPKKFVLLVDGDPARRTDAFAVPHADAYAGGIPALKPGATMVQGVADEPIDLVTTIISNIYVLRDGEVRVVFPKLPAGRDRYHRIIVRADAAAPFASVVDAVRVAQARGESFAFAVAPPPRAGLRLKEWEDCPFPPEADAARIDEAAVLLRVQVDASGRAVAVTVVEDPGHGFGEAARACALQAPYEPARDERGQPMAAMTNVFRVHFQRPPPDDGKR